MDWNDPAESESKASMSAPAKGGLVRQRRPNPVSARANSQAPVQGLKRGPCKGTTPE